MNLITYIFIRCFDDVPRIRIVISQQVAKEINSDNHMNPYYSVSNVNLVKKMLSIIERTYFLIPYFV